MKTFLSVDLDFWSASTERSLIGFFGHVFSLNLPIFVAPFHDQLLNHIDDHPCDQLINVDFHSDIVELAAPAEDLDLEELGEGNWANFVTWKQTGHFVWRYPREDRIHDGYTHSLYNPFKGDHSGWRSTRMVRGLGRLPWASIRAIGVCLSSNWLNGAPVRPITERLGIGRWAMMDVWTQKAMAKPFLWSAA